MFHFPSWSSLMFLTAGILLAVVFSVALLLTPKPKRRWTKVTSALVSLAVFGVLLVAHWFEPPMYQVHSEDDHVVAVFAPDGKSVILGGSEKTEVWDIDSRKVTATFRGTPIPFSASRSIQRARCLSLDAETTRSNCATTVV